MPKTKLIIEVEHDSPLDSQAINDLKELTEFILNDSGDSYMVQDSEGDSHSIMVTKVTQYKEVKTKIIKPKIK